jgi:hypothetical protein
VFQLLSGVSVEEMNKNSGNVIPGLLTGNYAKDSLGPSKAKQFNC